MDEIKRRLRSTWFSLVILAAVFRQGVKGRRLERDGSYEVTLAGVAESNVAEPPQVMEINDD